MTQSGGFGSAYFGGVSYGGAIPSGSVAQTHVDGVVRIQKTRTTQITGQTRIQHTNTETIQGAVCIDVEDINVTNINGRVKIYGASHCDLLGVVRVVDTMPEKEPQKWGKSDADKTAQQWGETAKATPDTWSESSILKENPEKWNKDNAYSTKTPETWNKGEKQPETWHYKQHLVGGSGE